MRSNNRSPFIVLALVSTVGLLLTTWGPALAQEEPLVIPVGGPGRKSMPIAIPRPKGDNGTVVDEFWSVVRRDLEISGWFTVIDPNAFVELPSAGIRPGEFNFEDWRLPGASVLAKTALTIETGKIRAEVWIYDVYSASKMDGRAFSAGTDGTRTVAHRVSNAIIKAVTGEDSIFNTRFAAVNGRSGNKEIYLVDVDGHGAIPVTRNGSINLQPSWSPSGDAIVYTSYRAGNPDLYVAELGQATTRRISARSGLNIGGSWSPLGDLIAVTLSRNGNSDLFSIEPYNGKEVARLTSAPGIDASAAWSPGGSQIAFVSDRSGGVHIYVMNSDGSNVRRVSFHGSYNTDPAFSPDGQHLAYVTREGNFDVVTNDLAGKDVRRITQGQGDNEDPSWSPDGRYIAFSSTRTGSSHIYIATSDGYSQVCITQDKGGWTSPAWSPHLSW